MEPAAAEEVSQDPESSSDDDPFSITVKPAAKPAPIARADDLDPFGADSSSDGIACLL